jgi:alanine dehydrogenase
VARTASKALSNIFAPMLLGIAGEGGVVPAIKDHNLIATGVYMFNGTLTNEEIAAERSLPWKPLDLLAATL